MQGQPIKTETKVDKSRGAPNVSVNANERKMHLFAMPMGAGGHIAGWRHPLADAGLLHEVDYYRNLAETAEQGKFDALFLADAQGFRTVEGKGAFARTDLYRMDPITLLSALSMATTRLGLIATLSTSYNEPYSAARRLATLDHISHGRAGWNVVTSTTQNEAHNFGRDAHFGHSERYARADEFIEVAKKLWDSWDEDAFLIDRENGNYIDPDKVHAVAHQGTFFKVAGPMTTGRPPQGYPVIVQAGSSEEGLGLAARTAEVVFTSHPSLVSARAFYDDLKRRVVEAGRPAGDLKILTAIQPIVAPTGAEAQQIEADLQDLIHPELAIALLQMQLGGFDLSSHDPDGPLPSISETRASQGTMKRILEHAARENLSIIQIARQIAAGRTSKTVSGTASQVADLLESWFREGAADGFVIAAPILPDMLARFVDGVVPILQQRGLFRTEYEGNTLREHLGVGRPVSRHAGHPELHVEPEIWQAG